MWRQFVFLLFLGWSALWADERKAWAVYYSDELPPHAFDGYELLALDSTYHPPLPALSAQHRTLLGYISLGEVENYRPHYERVQHLLSDENPNWPGSFYIDVRAPFWSRLVIEELIPAILAQGFNGIIIDTMDNPIYLEEEDPEKNRGMTDAAVRMIKAIRMHFPSIKIMVNRAIKILPQIGGDIDYVMGESIFADYDFENKNYKWVEEEEYRSQVANLQMAQRKFPQLQVVSLDYWDPEDEEGLRKIYREQRANGFWPYVATIDLKRLVKEPK